VARLHLLEIIELRAMNWIPNDKVTAYYKLKLTEVILQVSLTLFAPLGVGVIL
jgi:hypothetical protein